MTASPLSMSLSDYMAHLQVERGLSTNTLAAYRRDLGRYTDYLNTLNIESLDQVGEQQIADYVVTLSTGSDGAAQLGAASVGRAVVAVRGWHRFAAAEGITMLDPSAAVKPPQTRTRLPKALSVDEVARLLAGVGDSESPAGLRDRALLELLYATGARISEVVDLDVDDLDLDAEFPLVRLFGKGRKERIVPVGSYAMIALRAYLVRGRPPLASAGTGTAAVFINQRGGRLSRQSAWGIISKAAERSNLVGHVSPHTLRHSFATHLLSGGADIRVVQELLGHASVTTTQIYTKVTPDTLREVYATSHPRALG